MGDINKIKQFFRNCAWVFIPFLWYIIGITFIEQLLYTLFLWTVKTFYSNESYYEIFRFIAASRYALFPMLSGIVMTSFFVRLYREDWKLRVKSNSQGMIFNEDEIGTASHKKSVFEKISELNAFWWLITASAAACILLTVVINMLKDVLGLGAAMEEARKLGMAELSVLLPATLIVAPVFEELFFRGIIFRRARDRMGFLPSALLSAFIFGFVHDNMAQFILAFLMGLLFAYVYDLYESLLPAVLMHISANAVSLIVSSKLFDLIYEDKSILLWAVLLMCAGLVIYGIKKISMNRRDRYVLYSSFKKEANQ